MSCPTLGARGGSGSCRAGDSIALVTAGWAPSLAASELSKLRGEVVAGPLPAVDLGEVKALHAAIRQAVRSGALHSAHDVAEGGVAVALAESALASGLGASSPACRPRPSCSARGRARSWSPARPAALAAFGAAARVIGTVGGDAVAIEGVLSVPLDELDRAFTYGLADLLH